VSPWATSRAASGLCPTLGAGQGTWTDRLAGLIVVTVAVVLDPPFEVRQPRLGIDSGKQGSLLPARKQTRRCISTRGLPFVFQPLPAKDAVRQGRAIAR